MTRGLRLVAIRALEGQQGPGDSKGAGQGTDPTFLQMGDKDGERHEECQELSFTEPDDARRVGETIRELVVSSPIMRCQGAQHL